MRQFFVDSGKKNVYNFFITVPIYMRPSAPTPPKLMDSNGVILFLDTFLVLQLASIKWKYFRNRAHTDGLRMNENRIFMYFYDHFIDLYIR